MLGKYRQVLISTSLLVLLLNLTACGMIPKHISESDIPHDRWPIELYQPEEDLTFVRSSLSEASPGLLTALIDSVRDGKSEDAYASVLAFAEDNDLNDLFLAQIKQSQVLRQLSRQGEIIPSDNFDYSRLPDGFISVNALIQLTHDLSTLLVTLEFKEYTPGLTGFRVNGITQKYHYVHRLNGFDDKKSRSEYAAQWVELGEDEFVEIVESGIDEVIEMMKSYLADPNPTLLSKQEYYVEGYETMSWLSHIWGGDDGVDWLIRGNAQQLVFAAPKDFIQKAD